MSEARRFTVIVLLLLIGLGMVAVADAVEAWWPLFLFPLPYAVVPWLIVNAPPKSPGSGPGATEPS